MLEDNIRHQQRGYARPASGILAMGRCESGRAKAALETKNRVAKHVAACSEAVKYTLTKCSAVELGEDERLER
ncbi:unnamed protein product [Hydatigera taeniaeformis]|uniref:Uncharacterized protein n=1 Tax=Hydatigena taeniaeformis TaxID=6205 RepID=A0A0R3WX49_HYDTA|nr:unnamed protein product [Hydatigera taeniaeformis]